MTESPVDTFRRAAALMRERAEAATPGPWEYAGNGDITHGLKVIEGGIRQADWVASVDTGDGDLAEAGTDEANALHIASWHPLAALAVAEWLEWTADRAADELYRDTPEGPCCAEPSSCGGHDEAWFCRRCAEVVGEDCACWDRALAVADAYLTEVPA